MIKEIKANNLFFIRHEWFRSICIHNGFIGDAIFKWYQYFLNSKYFIVIQTCDDDIDALWFIHNKEVIFNGSRKGVITKRAQHTLSCNIITELITHFDRRVLMLYSTYSRKVYEVNEAEYSRRLMLSELSL